MISSKTLTRVALFVALCIVAAATFRFSSSIIPFSLVPFVVFLAGFLLRPQEAFLSMLLYVLLGLLGLPVFATPPFGGPAYIFRPTFGFLLGFILSAPTIAFLQKRKRKFEKAILGIFAGLGLLYLLGILYFHLAMNLFLGRPTNFGDTLKMAFLPFIGPDIAKAFCALLLAREVLPRLGRRA